MKHKVLKDFQLLIDKKIIILKSGTTLIDYKYITKTDNISLEKEVVDQNPDFFTIIDWKTELLLYIKLNKLPQPSILSKKIIPFIEENFIIDKPTTNSDELDRKIKKCEVLEKELKEELSDIETKNKSLKMKIKEYSLKEEMLDKRERDMEKLLLDSTKNIDSVQSELEQRLDVKIKDIEKREEELKKYRSDIKVGIVEFVKPIYPTLHDWGRNNYEKLLKLLE